MAIGCFGSDCKAAIAQAADRMGLYERCDRFQPQVEAMVSGKWSLSCRFQLYLRQAVLCPSPCLSCEDAAIEERLS